MRVESKGGKKEGKKGGRKGGRMVDSKETPTKSSKDDEKGKTKFIFWYFKLI